MEPGLRAGIARTDTTPPIGIALGGYEVEITPFTPEAAGLIVADCLSLLHELAG